MRKIVYYVATSIDGYIAKRDHSIEGFVGDGDAVDQYLNDLQIFDTVIMGRRTYEFGYNYGLVPGEPPYNHMKNYIFSDTLRFENNHPNVIVCPRDLKLVQQLKIEEGTDIYLCGGGDFAGWLLDHEQIDTLKIKLNPLILGDGIRLFGNSTKNCKMELVNSTAYNKGIHIMTYDVLYH